VDCVLRSNDRSLPQMSLLSRVGAPGCGSQSNSTIACWSFPIETPSGKVLGSFAMYYKEPTEATSRELDFAAALTRAASTVISHH